MTTCLGKSCSFGLPRVFFVNCCQFLYLVISLLVLRAGCGICLYQFLIIAYLFTFNMSRVVEKPVCVIVLRDNSFTSDLPAHLPSQIGVVCCPLNGIFCAIIFAWASRCLATRLTHAH